MRLEDILPITENAEEPIFVSMLRRLLAAKQPVMSVTDIFGTYRVAGIKHDASTGVYDLEAFLVNDDGTEERDTIGLSDEEAERSTLVKRGSAWYIETPDMVDESLDGLPLWFTTIKKLLDAEVPVYFAAGANKIIGAKQDHSLQGMPQIVLYLKHTKRKNFLQTYRVLEKSYDKLTLVKFNDGYALRFAEGTTPVSESVNEPEVVSMTKKLLAAGKIIYFRNRGGKKIRIYRVSDGTAVSGEPVWRFHDKAWHLDTSSATWKVGSNINKLMLAKDGDNWILYDTTVKLKESQEEVPLVVKLMNNRIAKGGAVEVDVTRAGWRVKGWVTREIVKQPVTDDLGEPLSPLYKLVTNDHPSGAKGRVLWLDMDADEHYTLQVSKDRNGNKTMRLVNHAAR